MSLSTEFEKIAALDLDPIKVKLMHVESGEGWSLEKANAVEQEYRRFLYLMKTYPTEQAAPLMDVDTFWHYHILDTQKYAVDCQSVFGFFLHHFPYIGLRGEDDLIAHERLGKRMAEIYEETFGESYIRPAVGARDSNTAFSAASGTAFSAASHPEARTAFSAANGTAFSAASHPEAKTAFSAAVAATAFSAAASGTAFSAASRPEVKTAFSAANAATAFSAVASGTAFSAAAQPEVKTAFSAASAPTAFSAASVAKQDPLFTVRPTLKDYKEAIKSE
jgi:hypothetical protein